MESASENMLLSPDLVQELLIVQVVMLAVASISYALRIAVKYKRSDAFGIDDVLALLGLVFFVAIEAIIWHWSVSSSQLLPRQGLHLVLYWSVTASCQLSILWFYRFVCSGFSWAKTLVKICFVLVVGGWIAFTICESLGLADAKSKMTSATTAPILYAYIPFEIASMVLEALLLFLFFFIQCFRLRHIREKLGSRPWLFAVPVVTLMAITSSALRLTYFRRQDIASEAICIQVHLGLSVLWASVPVYAGLETICCGGQDTEYDIRLGSIPPFTRNSSVRANTAAVCHVEDNDINDSVPPSPKESAPPTPRESAPSTPKFLSRAPSNASQWLSLSRNPSTKASSLHGTTREIVIEPAVLERTGTEFNPSRKPQVAENATKRLMFEG